MSAASLDRARQAAAALVAVLLVAGPLAACSRTGGAPDEAPPPPPPAEQPLAGAPDAPPPAADDADREPAPTPPPPASVESGPLEAPSAAPAGIVAMAPIPNPPESAPRRSYGSRRHHRVHHRFHAHHHHALSASGVRRAHAAHAGAAPPVRRAAPPLRHSAPVARHAPALRHGERRHAPGHAKHPTAGAVDHAAALLAVQTSLSSEIARTAVLAAPHAGPGVAADVMLNVPASFAETLRTEAGRQGLADVAASAALVARLSGAGYTVLPEGEQRQMIAAGQPTVFHWTVTGQPGARGPLQASVGAQLLGGNGQDRMDLGQVTGARTDDGLGWRIAGVALIVLLVAGGVALLARSRQRPVRRPDDGVIRRREPFTLRDDDRPQA